MQERTHKSEERHVRRKEMTSKEKVTSRNPIASCVSVKGLEAAPSTGVQLA